MAVIHTNQYNNLHVESIEYLADASTTDLVADNELFSIHQATDDIYRLNDKIVVDNGPAVIGEYFYCFNYAYADCLTDFNPGLSDFALAVKVKLSTITTLRQGIFGKLNTETDQGSYGFYYLENQGTKPTYDLQFPGGGTYVGQLNIDAATDFVNLIMSVDRDGYMDIYSGKTLLKHIDISSDVAIDLTQRFPLRYGAVEDDLQVIYKAQGIGISTGCVWNKALNQTDVDNYIDNDDAGSNVILKHRLNAGSGDTIYDMTVYDTPKKNIVYIGDSITRGWPTYNRSYPIQLKEMYDIPNVREMANFNRSDNGDKVLYMIDDGVYVDGLYKTGICDTLIFMGGINDYNGNGVTAPELYALIKTYVNARAATGWKVHVISNPSCGSAGWETLRAEVYTSMTTDAGFNCESVIDIRSTPVGMLNGYSDLTYFTPDQIHLTADALTIIANAVYNAIDLTPQATRSDANLNPMNELPTGVPTAFDVSTVTSVTYTSLHAEITNVAASWEYVRKILNVPIGVDVTVEVERDIVSGTYALYIGTSPLGTQYLFDNSHPDITTTFTTTADSLYINLFANNGINRIKNITVTIDGHCVDNWNQNTDGSFKPTLTLEGAGKKGDAYISKRIGTNLDATGSPISIQPYDWSQLPHSFKFKDIAAFQIWNKNDAAVWGSSFTGTPVDDQFTWTYTELLNFETYIEPAYENQLFILKNNLNQLIEVLTYSDALTGDDLTDTENYLSAYNQNVRKINGYVNKKRNAGNNIVEEKENITCIVNINDPNIVWMY